MELDKPTMEIKIGYTTYILSSEYSSTSTESLEQKLDRIIARNIVDFVHNHALNKSDERDDDV